MAEFICEQCDKGFTRARHGKRKIRFCSNPCYHVWRKVNNITTGQFRAGQESWNAGNRGFRPSQATEFKKGCKSHRRVDVGTVRIRTEKRRRKRAWVKVAEPNVWKLRAVVVWERANGRTPKGCVIHHVDEDALNDSLTNLCCLSRAAHLNIHTAATPSVSS